ncbi:cell cycle control protein [Anaeramoeba flamelloides]|uniref:Cell cycle control protein n=1 Tax=Anaeramoeba flamelloides TaxID=1746091 RepID=A0AAV7ZPG2_9EUKA|nr:cell cycle control protein [Anaeramoeba flamelloides]KAJ6249724.1 cell cycle control protein [Anaeramoeba flamelloides]
MNKPKDSTFKQQRLKGGNPILTPKLTIPVCIVIGIILLAVGIILLVTVGSVKEIQGRYDDKCKGEEICYLDFVPEEDMEAPVYFLYELSNYHQNHRRYIKSVSSEQLSGETITYDDSSVCEPIRSYKDKEKNDMVYEPCGLVAWSVFNDTFKFTDSDSNDLGVSEKEITWKSDREEIFQNPSTPIDPLANTTIVSDLENEHFIVWMRIAALPTFRKLYAILEKGKLEKSKTYTIEIGNNYPVESFEGTKSLIITTTTFTGGKNSFLGYVYIITGAILFLVGILFLSKHLIKPRDLGDETYLTWHH